MKNLKIFAFFLCMFTLFACSEDDDAIVNENDPIVEENDPVDEENDPVAEDVIVGKWFVEGYEEEGNYIEADSCRSQSFYQFFANGNLTAVIYGMYNNSCDGEYDDPDSWEKIDENQYELSDGEVTYSFTTTFSDNNNSFVMDNGVNIVYFSKNE